MTRNITISDRAYTILDGFREDAEGNKVRSYSEVIEDITAKDKMNILFRQNIDATVNLAKASMDEPEIVVAKLMEAYRLFKDGK